MRLLLKRLSSRLRASKALGADLCFFLLCVVALTVVHEALNLVPLDDQNRDALLTLHFKITYAALAIMGAKLLLHLLQLPEEDQE